MLDRRRILAELNGKEPTRVEETDGTVLVAGNGFEMTLNRDDYLQENCAICIHRNPVLYDELLGDLVAEQQNVDRYADVRQVEAMSAEERWQSF